MQENVKVKGLAVFSKEEQVKERSLKLYTYFICHSYLRNEPSKFGDNVRIFKHRDINLQEIKRVLGFDPDTTKKYLGELEKSNLIKFEPNDWHEEKYDEKGQLRPLTQRWKERQKHKDTYYEIPNPPVFRKIPKETLIELNEIFNVSELTVKIYITLCNFQEICNIEGMTYKKFTYQDMRELLGYKLGSKIDRKIEAALCLLKGMGLIDLEQGKFINKYGTEIPCFALNQVNFYTNYDMKGFKTGEYSIVPEEIKSQIILKYKQEYFEAFS